MIPYDKIKIHYERLTPRIFEVSKNHPSRWVSPYTQDIDWPTIMTPIEFDMWQSIRSMGKFPLYPQYPIGKHFTDFGNPFLKVSVECDGKEFHQDKNKDRQRDEYFKSIGWTVYRVPGSICYKIVDIETVFEDDYDKALQEYYMETSCGFIRALALHYFDFGWNKEEERSLAEQCLNKWRSS